ncbi:hypothetical protein EOM86_01385 [Candidatus Nomurabacteria bacterium]|nr:hypothetical protein [Candidatus Nomurabacteria bacterium]
MRKGLVLTLIALLILASMMIFNVAAVEDGHLLVNPVDTTVAAPPLTSFNTYDNGAFDYIVDGQNGVIFSYPTFDFDQYRYLHIAVEDSTGGNLIPQFYTDTAVNGPYPMMVNLTDDPAGRILPTTDELIVIDLSLETGLPSGVQSNVWFVLATEGHPAGTVVKFDYIAFSDSPDRITFPDPTPTLAPTATPSVEPDTDLMLIPGTTNVVAPPLTSFNVKSGGAFDYTVDSQNGFIFSFPEFDFDQYRYLHISVNNSMGGNLIPIVYIDGDPYWFWENLTIPGEDPDVRITPTENQLIVLDLTLETDFHGTANNVWIVLAAEDYLQGDVISFDYIAFSNSAESIKSNGADENPQSSDSNFLIYVVLIAVGAAGIALSRKRIIEKNN